MAKEEAERKLLEEKYAREEAERKRREEQRIMEESRRRYEEEQRRWKEFVKKQEESEAKKLYRGYDAGSGTAASESTNRTVVSLASILALLPVRFVTVSAKVISPEPLS